jgi:hypothetical protein
VRDERLAASADPAAASQVKAEETVPLEFFRHFAAQGAIFRAHDCAT